VQIDAAGVFGLNGRVPAAMVVYFKGHAAEQAGAAEIFDFNDHDLLQSLAARVIHLNCSDSVSGIIHL
jgi:hypothetical protein